MRAAIYVRVSTQRQAQTQTIDQQLERLQAVVAERGWELPDGHVFRDDGYSGAYLRRPGLDRLRDQAALARLDVILITDPDRLARNYVHQVLLLEELQRHGCRVEFLDRPLSDDPHDQLLLQIRGAVAEYERTLIAERTRRGRLHKLQSGHLLPWTRPPYGYRADPDRPRDPAGVRTDPSDAAVVVEMFAWYVQNGRSLLGLVKHLHDLGVPSPSGKPYWGLASVRGILSNPSYTGQIYANRTRCRPARIRRSATHPIGRPKDTQVPVPPDEWIPIATIPAIITREQFDQARAKMATNRSFATRNNKVTKYALRALVSCGVCGLACQARRVLPHNTYYICTGKNREVRQRIGATCSSRFVPADALDELVWADLANLLRRPEHVAAALQRAAGGCWLPQELQARQESLRRGQVSLSQQVERLTEAYLGGVVSLTEYQRRRTGLDRRDAALAAQRQQLSGEANRAYEVAGLVTSMTDFCQRVAAGLHQATFEQKRQLIELLIDRVVVTGDEVEIRYVFPIGPAGEYVRFCHLRLDYLADPQLVDATRLWRVQDQVRTVAPVVPAVGGLGHERLRLNGAQPLGFQHFGHPARTARLAQVRQLLGDPAGAVAAAVFPKHGPHQRRQRGLPALAARWLAIPPGVIRRPTHAQNSAYRCRGQRVVVGDRLDGGVHVGYSCRPKMANAFFRMSRSRSARCNSISNSRTRASSDVATGPVRSSWSRFQR